MNDIQKEVSEFVVKAINFEEQFIKGLIQTSFETELLDFEPTIFESLMPKEGGRFDKSGDDERAKVVSKNFVYSEELIDEVTKGLEPLHEFKAEFTKSLIEMLKADAVDMKPHIDPTQLRKRFSTKPRVWIK